MEERISMSQRERERLKVLHQLERGGLKQTEAAERLELSARQVRRLQRSPDLSILQWILLASRQLVGLLPFSAVC